MERSLKKRDLEKRDLEKRLSRLGWRFLRHGGNHDYWTNGKVHEPIPRHREIGESLAKKIIKTAEKNPPTEW